MRQRTIEHLAVLQITLTVEENLDEDERILAMNLTPVYEKWRQQTLQEGRQEGRQEGMQQGECSLICRQLTYRLGELPSPDQAQIQALSLEYLESLGEALLEFSSLEDLSAWLRLHPSD
jgi:predicted transposase YdaD